MTQNSQQPGQPVYQQQQPIQQQYAAPQQQYAPQQQQNYGKPVRSPEQMATIAAYVNQENARAEQRNNGGFIPEYKMRDGNTTARLLPAVGGNTVFSERIPRHNIYNLWLGLQRPNKQGRLVNYASYWTCLSYFGLPCPICEALNEAIIKRPDVDFNASLATPKFLLLALIKSLDMGNEWDRKLVNKPTRIYATQTMFNAINYLYSGYYSDRGIFIDSLDAGYDLVISRGKGSNGFVEYKVRTVAGNVTRAVEDPQIFSELQKANFNFSKIELPPNDKFLVNYDRIANTIRSRFITSNVQMPVPSNLPGVSYNQPEVQQPVYQQAPPPVQQPVYQQTAPVDQMPVQQQQQQVQQPVYQQPISNQIPVQQQQPVQQAPMTNQELLDEAYGQDNDPVLAAANVLANSQPNNVQAVQQAATVVAPPQTIGEEPSVVRSAPTDKPPCFRGADGSVGFNEDNPKCLMCPVELDCSA